MIFNAGYILSLAALLATPAYCSVETIRATRCSGSKRKKRCQFNAKKLNLDTASSIDFVVSTGQRVKCNKRKVRGDNVWFGICDGDASDANFVRRRDRKSDTTQVFGSVHVGSDICQFSPNAEGVDEMTCTAMDAFPAEKEADQEPPHDDAGERALQNLHFGFNPGSDVEFDEKQPLRGRRNLYDDSGATIDVMVVWTRQAECKVSKLTSNCTLTVITENNIRGLIDLAVAETNTAFQLSGILSSLRLVHAYRDPVYVEPTTNAHGIAFSDLRGSTDGKLDDVHVKRALYGADMVQMLISNTEFCGTATTSSGRVNAFAVVATACATGYYSFAHEIGHNFGMKHDRGTVNACNATGINFGYRAPDASFRSILAYNCRTRQCDNMPKNGCPRVQRFSNTQFLYNGKPMGNQNNDNAQQWNNVRATVASYYPAMNCNTNVQCNDNNASTIDTCNIATATCVFTPIVTSKAPTRVPSKRPTKSPTKRPTKSPTKRPTSSPTKSTTLFPTKVPTRNPTKLPTVAPTNTPTSTPTHAPTSAPTKIPTTSPTSQPTSIPTKLPTSAPTSQPTSIPTKLPTSAPTSQPTSAPTKLPTSAPTSQPTYAPTKLPTSAPTNPPTSAPTKLPTKVPTTSPTKPPTSAPTNSPTSAPTKVPTASPTKQPTKRPTITPTDKPTRIPTHPPTKSPTEAPTVTPIKIPTRAPLNPPTRTPTNVPTRAPIVPSPSHYMESQVVTGISSSTWTNVTLYQRYISPIVVCSVQYDLGIALMPAVVRMQNVQNQSFQIRIQNPSNNLLTERTVHCIIVEEGSYRLPDGRKIEGRKYLSTTTYYNKKWGGDAQKYMNVYTNPIVLGQVMTYNDVRWSVFFGRGKVHRSTPPNAQGLRCGKHVGEDAQITRSPEIVGYIVMEKGHASFAGTEMETGRTSEAVIGYVQNKYTATFASPFESTPIVTVVSQAGMNGAEGSWAVTSGKTSSTFVGVAVDEDQTFDTERSHPKEEVDYIALTTVGVIPLTK